MVRQPVTIIENGKTAVTKDGLYYYGYYYEVDKMGEMILVQNFMKGGI
jgi:hypothetical protein